MSLVTGFGNEVVTVTVAFVVTTVVSLVWRSTRVRERPNFVTATIDVDVVANDDDATRRDESTSREANVTDPTSSSTTTAEAEEPFDDADCVTIRVRFIDETQFEVRSPLSVTLGQFKSRHLKPTANGAAPIRPNDRVRLIFNGKVLGSEASTLAQLGLSDNCTVHCLVQRNQGQPSSAGTGGSGGQTSAIDIPGDLDLSGLCYPVLGTVLFVIWWCQVVYAHYFTFTSTMSLVSLTFLYAASVANAYLTH